MEGRGGEDQALVSAQGPAELTRTKTPELGMLVPHQTTSCASCWTWQNLRSPQKKLSTDALVVQVGMPGAVPDEVRQDIIAPLQDMPNIIEVRCLDVSDIVR